MFGLLKVKRLATALGLAAVLSAGGAVAMTIPASAAAPVTCYFDFKNSDIAHFTAT